MVAFCLCDIRVLSSRTTGSGDRCPGGLTVIVGPSGNPSKEGAVSGVGLDVDGCVLEL